MRRLALVVVLAAARVASAHQSSIKYVDLSIDGAHIDVSVKLAASDVAEAMSLPPDAKPAPAAAAAAPRVPGYVQRWLAIGNPDACMAAPASARVDADNFVVVAWQVQCAEASDTLVLDFSAFFALDKRMEAIVRFGTGETDVVVVRAGDSPVTLHATVAHPFVRGLARGWPAALFALALVLGITRTRTSLGAVIGAFATAELVAIVIGTSGVVAIPARLAAILAAVSLAYIAIDRRPNVAQRAAIGAAFGVAHGLALATTAPHDDLGAYVAGTQLLVAIGVFLGVATGARRTIAIAICATIFAIGLVRAAIVAM